MRNILYEIDKSHQFLFGRIHRALGVDLRRIVPGIGDADRDRRAREDGRFNLERETVVIVDAQPLEDIPDAVAAALCVDDGPFLLREKLRQLALFDADAVVRDLNLHIAADLLGGQPDDALAIAELVQPVEQAVFDDRLQNQLHDRVVGDIRRDLGDELHVAAAAEVCQLHEEAHVLHLVAQRQKVAAVAQAEPVEARELHDDVHGFLVAARHGFPGDHVQRIVEEMRVDLRLQGAQLHVLEVLAEIVALVDEQADPADHEVEAVLQLADLVLAVHDAADAEVAVLHAPHLLRQRFDPPRAVAGVQIRKAEGDDADDDREQNHLIPEIQDRGEEVAHRGDGEDPPAVEDGGGKAVHGVAGRGDAGGGAECIAHLLQLRRKIRFGNRECRVGAADDVQVFVDEVGCALLGVVVALQDVDQIAFQHIDADDAENACDVLAAADQRDNGKHFLRFRKRRLEDARRQERLRLVLLDELVVPVRVGDAAQRIGDVIAAAVREGIADEKADLVQVLQRPRRFDRLVQLVHVVVFLAEADAGVLLFQNLVHLGGLRDGGGDRGDFVQLRFHLVFGLLQVEPRDLHRLLLDDRRAPVGGEDGEHDDRDEDQQKKGGEELYTHRAVFVAER